MPAQKDGIISLEENAGVAGATAAAPKSWTYLFLAACILAGMAVAAGALTVQFLQARPFNLRAQTTYLAKEAEKTLLRNYVPEDDVRVGTPELQRDEGAAWFLYRIEADLPAQVNPEGAENLIKERMLKERVHVLTEPMEGQARRLRLQLADRDFANIVLAPAVAAQEMSLRHACQEIADIVEKCLLEAGVPGGGLVREIPVDRGEGNVLWLSTRFRVTLPAEITAEDLHEKLSRALLSLNAPVYAGTAAQGAVSLYVDYSGKRCAEIVCLLTDSVAPAPSVVPPPAPELPGPVGAEPLPGPPMLSFEEIPLDSVEHEEPPPIPRESAKRTSPLGAAKVAIILDDGGFGGSVSEEVLNLDPGLTLAILPNTPHAQEVAAAAAAKGFEIMLHMPMETHSTEVKAFPGQLNTAMPEDEIARLTQDALTQIPGVVGVNNHTGSKFAEDETGLTRFMNVLKEHQLFFVDSRTLATTKALAVAQSLGIPAAERDVFLDNDGDPAKIGAQFDALVDKAKTSGRALGIGHFRANTVKVLADLLPKLSESGVRLVHASELVQ